MKISRTIASLLLIFSLSTPIACTDQGEQTDADGTSNADVSDRSPSPEPAGGASSQEANPGKRLLTHAEQGLPAELAPLRQAWTGDLDGMLERRMIRVLTVYQAGGYYLDGPSEKGMTFELVKMFEKALNEGLDTGHLKVHVVLIPVEFDRLLPALIQGYGDIAVAGLTVTQERRDIVDFSAPLYRDISEIVITGPAAPQIETLDDLSGKNIYIKPGSSYRGSLEALNDRFGTENRPLIEIIDAPQHLQDVDLLEMVSAGLLPMVIMDDFKAHFWAEIMDDLTLRDDLVVASGRNIAWAMRKNSPLLKAEIDDFARDHRKGTLMGNILINRYLKDSGWVDNALDPADWGRFNDTVDLFKKYSNRYAFDYLMVAALGYQESRLDQSMRSHAGAIGIMQLLKSTATDPNIAIPDIEQAEHNIHAGVKYLDFIRNRYFATPDIDDLNRALFSFAAYNAGPARVRGLMQQAGAAGLDPNKWFNNVELIAARDIGREPVDYVSNISKYYFAYRTITDQAERNSRSLDPARATGAQP